MPELGHPRLRRAGNRYLPKTQKSPASQARPGRFLE